MGDVDAGIEVGGFVDYKWEQLQARMELRQGWGGHEGMVADAQVNYTDNYGPLRFAAGPRLSWASADYHETYFGINARQSARTGLVRYEPGNGLVSYGVGSVAILPVADRVSVTAFAGYDRLGDQVTDSPLIDERGSDDQLTTGLGISYRFGFNG
jgi:outer membrane scaffolding protein for murein synthesis (MipA/OmpV family)